MSGCKLVIVANAAISALRSIFGLAGHLVCIPFAHIVPIGGRVIRDIIGAILAVPSKNTPAGAGGGAHLIEVAIAMCAVRNEVTAANVAFCRCIRADRGMISMHTVGINIIAPRPRAGVPMAVRITFICVGKFVPKAVFQNISANLTARIHAGRGVAVCYVCFGGKRVVTSRAHAFSAMRLRGEYPIQLMAERREDLVCANNTAVLANGLDAAAFRAGRFH